MEAKKKVFEDIIDFLAFQGDNEELKILLYRARIDYGLNIGDNQELDIRLGLSLALERLTTKTVSL